MAITSLDTFIGAGGWDLTWYKNAARTTVLGNWYTGIDLAGNPGTGVLSGGSTQAAGVIVTDATTGIPANGPTFSGTGYLSSVDYGSNVACRIRLYDLIWKAGAYAFNANTAVTSPSWASRVPGGTDFSGLELWYEQVTTGTGIQAVTVTYTNQAGTGSRSTGAFSIGVAGVISRMHNIPLQAGDSGLQSIQNVQGSTASAGTFNILMMRPLWSGRVKLANDGDTDGAVRTGMPIIFDDTAFYPIVNPDSTSFGVPEMQIGVVYG